jgi:hypothetical protein
LSSTRNDGKPTPDPDTYWLLVTLTWLAVPVVEVFGTAVLTGIHQTDEDRAGYWPSWAWCCTLAGTAVLVFYTALSSARRHGGRAVVRAQRLQSRPGWKREAEVAADLEEKERRKRLFGKQGVPMAIAMSPLLWALPLTFAGAASLPPDPDTGQKGVDTANLTIGLVLPVVTILLWLLTGWLLTTFAVAVWLGWAVGTASGHLEPADVIGVAGLVALAVMVPVAVAVRQRAVARQDAAAYSAPGVHSLTGPAPQELRARRSRTSNGLIFAYRSLQTVMVLALVCQEIFTSITLYRLPHSGGSELVLSGSLAIAATVAFYATLAVIRSRRTRETMAKLLPPTNAWGYEGAAEAFEAKRRVSRFSPTRMPVMIAITPTVWTLPVWIGGLAYAVRDPETGQPGPNLLNLAVGAVLAFTARSLWKHTNRTLTGVGLAVWTGWTALTLAGHPFAGGVIAGLGILPVVAARYFRARS